MNDTYCPVARWWRLACLVATGLFLTACSGESWKEEALQPDGSKIIVMRTVEREGRHEIGQMPPIKTQSIEFKLPATNEQVKWVDLFSEDLGSASFLPMLVAVRNSDAYVLANPMGCLAYNKWGRPNPPYIVFKYKNRTWGQVTLSELPLEFKVPNIVQSSPDIDAKKTGESPVSAKTIAQMVSEFKQPEFKALLREPIQYPAPGCERLEQYKGKWIRPGDPLARQWIDSQEKK